MDATLPLPAAAPALAAPLTARRYFLDMDAVRAALMLLGVPYHAARIYSASHGYGVESPVPSPALTLLAAVLHSFRMEAFFLVAGFFAAMVLARSTPRSFLSSRLIRIGVPLAACALLFPPVFGALVAAMARPGGLVDPAGAARLLPPAWLWWVMHLWFLGVLMLLTLLLAAATASVHRWPRAAALAAGVGAELSALTRRRFAVGGMLLALLIALVWTLPLALKHAGVDLQPLGHLFDLRQAIRFLPLFAFGVALWAQADVRDWFNRPEPLSLPIALAGSAIFSVGEYVPALGFPCTALGAGIAGLFWAQLLVSLAVRHMRRSSPVITWLAGASYTVYLFHFPLTLALGLVCISLAVPPLPAFAVITVVTLAICFAIHALVRRSRLLAFLFNGRPLRVAP